MSRLEASQNLLFVRLLYWGPAGAGKTATLSALRRLVDPEDKLRLYTVGPPDGATRFFDLLALEDFKFGQLRVRTRVVGAPGARSAQQDRVALLGSADAVVFVADSQRSREDANLDSVRDLASAMRASGRESIPIVWGLNQRDGDAALTVGDLRALLGCGDRPVHETVATQGTGVLECFDDALRAVLKAAATEHGLLGPEGDEIGAKLMLPQLVRGGKSRFTRPRTAESREFTFSLSGPAGAQAIEAQLKMTEAHAELDAVNRQLEGRNKELMAINRVARSILSAMEPDNLLVVLLDATADYVGVTHASCVVFDPTGEGQLRSHVHGFGRDPILGLPQQDAARFFKLMEDSDGPVPATDQHNPSLLRALRRVDRRVRGALFQAIRGNVATPSGWLGIYNTEAAPALSTQKLLFLSSISRLAALGLEKIGMLDALERRAGQLQGQLEERVSDLEMANARLRAMNRGTESRVTERTRALEAANRALREKSAASIHQARLSGMSHLAASLATQLGDPLDGLGRGLGGLRAQLDDLRSSLAGLPNATEGLAIADRIEGLLDDSRQGEERVSGLVGSLKRFGGPTGELGPTRINAVVADAITLLNERIRGAASLDLRLGELPEVEADPVQLRHVVLALLTNAVEAMEGLERPGQLVVSTFLSGDEVTLMFQDSGRGIERSLLPRIFEPFVTTKEGDTSAGIGLHCAYRGVKHHGGKITVRSKPGEGTTVKVLLPVRQAAEVPVQPAQPALPQRNRLIEG